MSQLLHDFNFVQRSAASHILNSMGQCCKRFSHCLLLRQALQVEFFGDGVVEAWRGSQHGELSVRCHEGPAIFKGHFGPDYETHAWGIAGIGFVPGAI